ncbi:MAG: tetratricopeptide repeat protein [Vampirovibrionales bacterium]|nr:tetratricopeptide repeat protein [Vampirovibrionales bacterium]
MPKPSWGWVVKGLMLSFSLLAGFTVGLLATFYIQFYLPADTYDQTRQGEWARLNARLLSFESEQDFKTAEALLYRKLQDPDKSESLTPYYLLASLFEASGEDAKAIQTYNAYLTLAKALPWQGHLSQALSDDVYASLAVLYYRAGRLQDAKTSLSALPETATLESAPLLNAMGDVLADPNRGDYRYELGKAFRQSLDLPMAKKEFELALLKTQDPALKLKIQNTLLAKMPAHTLQLKPLARYLCLAADNLEAQVLQGRSEKPDQAENKAIRLYKQSLEVSPEFEWAYQQIAHLYQKQENYPQAVHYAKLALSYNPDLYLSQLTLGDIALAQADYPAAVAHFNDAGRILADLQDDYHQPLLVNVQTQIGFSQELLNNPNQALSHYRQALSLGRQTPFADASDIDYARDGVKRMEANLIRQAEINPQKKKSLLAKGI